MATKTDTMTEKEINDFLKVHNKMNVQAKINKTVKWTAIGLGGSWIVLAVLGHPFILLTFVFQLMLLGFFWLAASILAAVKYGVEAVS